MTAPAAAPERIRYRDDPTVGTVLRSPRLFVREALAGLVVALALIPEAISFSIIAGVDPRVGLFASFTMAVTIAVVGSAAGSLPAAARPARRSNHATAKPASWPIRPERCSPV